MEREDEFRASNVVASAHKGPQQLLSNGVVSVRVYPIGLFIVSPSLRFLRREIGHFDTVAFNDRTYRAYNSRTLHESSRGLCE